jgi:uroporphyrinogen decarboxylase
MNSREIVRRTLEFEYPERVAHSFPPSDVIAAGPEIPKPEGEWQKIDGRQWRRTDEWGNVWGRVDDTSKGEIIEGALGNLDDVEEFPLPNFSNATYYARAKDTFSHQPDHWYIGYIHGFTFSVARKLRRMERYLMDLLLEPEKIRVLHNRIDEMVKIQMEQMKEAGADSVMIAEDWGTQTQTLISPTLWREEFKPRFVELCSYAHSLGLKMFMHSCGKITAIIPDLIEAGVDLFQFDQPRIHGIDTLQEMQELGDVTFWCPVDIQTTLQTKDETRVRQEANEMLKKLWRGRGGFIAGYYQDEASIGLEPEWQQIASAEFLHKGRRELFIA